MGNVLKPLLGIIALLILGRVIYVQINKGLDAVEKQSEEASKATERYLSQTDEVREKMTVSNDQRAIGTAIKMFMIDRGHPPRTLDELVQSGTLSGGSTNDPFGQPYRYQIQGNQAVIVSSGRDRVIDTEDDIKSTISIQ